MSSHLRRLSLPTSEDAAFLNTEMGQEAPQPAPAAVTWLSLPRKSQLAILFCSRLVDFLQVAALQAYMFHQLKSFDPSQSDATVSSQAGILQGCYTAAQVATAIIWGKVADAHWGGRKLVLLVGLGGTAVSCIGYGFSSTFAQACFFRIVGGGINGTVGIIRTMIAEIVKEKKYLSRAFLLLPLSFNVAALLGPVMGGLLSDPTTSYPALFGTHGVFSMSWMEKYPYALPSVMNAFFLTLIALIAFFGLEETLESRQGSPDLGLNTWSTISRFLHMRPASQEYTKIGSGDNRTTSFEMESTEKKGDAKPPVPSSKRQLPFSRIWTRNVIFTLITVAMFDFHMGAFNNLWNILLSTPRFDSTTTSESQQLPFHFSGGLGMPSATVGIATAIIGGLGMILQLFLYPAVHARLGTILSFRYFLLCFPIAYFFAPYLVVLPSSSAPPAQANGPIVWFGITFVLFFQVIARTFALPATIILINNCSPHPSVLGTIHGLGQSTSAAFRTIGPTLAGIWYGIGLVKGVVGLSWWATAGVAIIGCVTAMWVYEGSGHEIMLEGEGEEEEEEEERVSVGQQQRQEEDAFVIDHDNSSTESFPGQEDHHRFRRSPNA